MAGACSCCLGGRPQTLQTLPQASKATTLTATCPCHLFFRGFKAAVCPAQTPQTFPQASKATTLTATCPCHLFFRGFKTAVCPASNAPNPSAGLQGNNSYSYMPLPSVFQGVQDCRLPGLKPPKPSRRPFSGGSRLPFARPQTLQTLPQASKATTLTATCPCHLFFRGFKTAVCPASNVANPSAGLQGNNSYSYRPLPSVFQGVQDCRLPGLKPPKPSRRPFSGGSRLPFARPQTLQTLPQASKATTLTATCPCHLFFREFKTAVCPASNPPNPSAGLQGNNSYSYMPLPSVFQGVQDCRLPGLKPPKPSRRPFSGGSRLPFARPQTLLTLPQASKATTLTARCPCHLFFRGFKTAVCPASNPPNPSAGLQGNNSYSYMPLPSVFQGVQDCRLPGLKPPKPFRRPPRQQLLQLHAPAICFSGGSRLPFARAQTLQTLPRASKATTLTATGPCHLFLGGSRLPFALPQTLQTLPQASKATTLTATCPCHLFFRGFKAAVCPASNPQTLPQASKATTLTPAICFQGVQDCRLPGLKQLHAAAICFSGGSRLSSARPQTLQTLPQASKATTLTATCPCHLFFRGFKTAVCPASNPPNPSAGFFQGVQDCRLPGLKPSKPFRRPPRQQLLHLPSVFQGVQDCRLPGLKPPKPFRRPPRQQLLQLHAPAICFSGGSKAGQTAVLNPLKNRWQV